MTEIISLVALVLVRVNQLLKQQGDFIMAITPEIQTLKDQNDTLIAAAAAREERDRAQDAVTAAQIATLKEQVNALQAMVAAGGLSAEDKEAVSAVIANTSATIASLEAADLPPVA